MTGYRRSGRSVAAYWMLAVGVLLASGAVYRALAPRWQGTGQRTVKLPVPLGEFPLSAVGWTGTEASIPALTQEYMRQNFADDYFSRRYASKAADASVNVYVVYCSSRPSGIQGHRPGVCYRGSGWIPDSTDRKEFTSARGAKIPCLIERFHRPAPNYQEVVVLSFYVVNGQTTAKEEDFSGMMGRNPNISGDPAKYVAQVQISSPYENSILKAATDLSDVILDYLPDKAGKVNAAPAAAKPAPAASL
jgi:EpsI family protein